MTGATAGARRTSTSAYLRLAKVDVPELWIGVPIAWTLVPPDKRLSAIVVFSLLLSWIAVVSTTSAAQALDDYQGWHDGTDHENYDPASGRSRSRKPLLEGELKPSQALRFGIALAVVGVGCLVAMAVLASFEPWWAWLGMAISVAAALQYSFGAKLSYRWLGGGEITLALAMACTLAMPYAVVTKALPGAVIVESVLLGFWILQVSICSSTNDAIGDRRAGRRTVAATVSMSANERFVAGVVAFQWCIGVAAVVAGILSGWQALALLPSFVLQVFQLHRGVRGHDWIAARKLGFRSMRLGGFLLMLANILTVR